MLEEEGIVFDEALVKIRREFFVRGGSSLSLDDLKLKSKTAVEERGKRIVENVFEQKRSGPAPKKSKYFAAAVTVETLQHEILDLLQTRDAGKTC